VSVSDALAPDCDRANLGTLVPGASTSYTCTKTNVTAGFTNVAVATGTAPDGTTPSSVTDNDDAVVSLPAAKITPTATTCEMFRDGTAADLNELLYTLKGNKINSVAPGVLFYYNLVTVAAGDTITVDQTDNSGSTPALGVQQAILWNLDCTKAADGTVSGDGATVTFIAPATGTYIISIKYTPETVKRTTNPGTVTYSFSTSVNGLLVVSSLDTIVLKKK